MDFRDGGMLRAGVDGTLNHALSLFQKFGVKPTDRSCTAGVTPEVFEARVEAIITRNGVVSVVFPDESGEVTLVLNSTNFLAESGGQTSDAGVIISPFCSLNVDNVHVQQDYVLHKCRLQPGSSGNLSLFDRVTLHVDYTRRALVESTHTCSHLLQFALETVLGEVIQVTGCAVSPEKLSLEFLHAKPLDTQELACIESFVKNKITESSTIYTKELALREATNARLVSSTELCPDPVKVVSVGISVDKLIRSSQKFKAGDCFTTSCAGRHVPNTRDVQEFALLSEEAGNLKGARRITASTGKSAKEAVERAKTYEIQVSEISKLTGSTQEMLLGSLKLCVGLAEVPAVSRAFLLQQLQAIQMSIPKEIAGHDRMTMFAETSSTAGSYVREALVRFFKRKGHAIVELSTVLRDEETTITPVIFFCNPEQLKVCTVVKCVGKNGITHERIETCSSSDQFSKKNALVLAMSCFKGEFRLPVTRFSATYFAGREETPLDLETKRCWGDLLPATEVSSCPDNFCEANGGFCGPFTEIFFDVAGCKIKLCRILFLEKVDKACLSASLKYAVCQVDCDGLNFVLQNDLTEETETKTEPETKGEPSLGFDDDAKTGAWSKLTSSSRGNATVCWSRFKRWYFSVADWCSECSAVTLANLREIPWDPSELRRWGASMTFNSLTRSAVPGRFEAVVTRATSSFVCGIIVFFVLLSLRAWRRTHCELDFFEICLWSGWMIVLVCPVLVLLGLGLMIKYAPTQTMIPCVWALLWSGGAIYVWALHGSQFWWALSATIFGLAYVLISFCAKKVAPLPKFRDYDMVARTDGDFSEFFDEWLPPVHEPRKRELMLYLLLSGIFPVLVVWWL